MHQMLPQITSHLPGATVHSRLLLVTGLCGFTPSAKVNGDIWITTHNHSFPAQCFPVRSSTFKALIHLVPGDNSITLDFRPASSGSHVSVFDVSYIPLLQNPPLHLVIIIGSDSKLRYDDCPSCPEPPTIETAIKKLRMAGYMWQAYTGSEMAAQGFGNRTFRLDEAWLPDSLSKVDSPRRSTAKVTVLRSKYSTEHIRHPSRAQQGKGASKGLFEIAVEAIRESEELKPGGREKVHVAAMFLDAHYERGLITGHAALGCEDVGGIALAIFGSHSLFAWPSCIENIVNCFNDTRTVDTKHCGIDVEGSTYWMAANVGIGAFLHETGHLFGCPHQPSGVMLRDYTRLHRSFTVLSPDSNLPKEECHWHRLDCLRFLMHPSFRLPSDPAPLVGAPTVLGTHEGLLISSPSPIHLIEFRHRAKGEHPTSTTEPNTTTVLIPRHEIDTPDLKLEIFSRSGFKRDLDFGSLPPLFRVYPGGVFRTPVFGQLKSKVEITPIPHPLRMLRIHCGLALDGIEFFPAHPHGKPALFGKCGGSPKDFVFQPGEELRGFAVRSGGWVDALGVVTNLRRSQVWGGTGGGDREVVLGVGMRMVGVFGSVERWVMGVGGEYVCS